MEEKQSSLKSIGIVGIATMLSRVVGLLREVVFAALFSRTATDAFLIANTIPNLLRRLLAEGILSTAFIPVFSEELKENTQKQKQVLGAIFSLFLLILVGVTFLGILTSPWLVKLFAGGFSQKEHQLTVFLTQLTFPYILLVGLSSYWVGLLHTHQHFTAPALGPVLLNVGVIVSALAFSSFFKGDYQVTSMAIGILVGGLLQLLLQVWACWKKGLWFSWNWNPKEPAVHKILALLAPTLLGLGVYQINVLISRNFASFLPTGSVTYIGYSDRLTELPLGVVAVAFATVNLPALSRKVQEQDWKGFRKTLFFGIQGVLFLCIPVAVAFFFLKEPIVVLLFERGRFTHQDALACAQVLGPAVWGLVFVAVLRNLTPAFYAMKDTKTPVKIAALSLVINVIFSYFFAFFLKWQAFGLTLANTLSSVFSMFLSFAFLKKVHSEFSFSMLLPSLGKTLLASFGMAMVLNLLLWWIPFPQGSKLLQLFAVMSYFSLSFLGFLFLAWLLKVEELKQLVQKIQTKLRRK